MYTGKDGAWEGIVYGISCIEAVAANHVCVLSNGCSVLSCVLSKEGCNVLARRSERDYFPGLAFSICRFVLCVTRSFRFIWGKKRHKRRGICRGGRGVGIGRERRRPVDGVEIMRGEYVSVGATVEMG